VSMVSRVSRPWRSLLIIKYFTPLRSRLPAQIPRMKRVYKGASYKFYAQYKECYHPESI